MALNVCRVKPAMYIPIVMNVYNKNELARRCKHVKALVRQLQTTAALPALNYDEKATKACEQNNAAIVELN
jgi:hypothetical protein